MKIAHQVEEWFTVPQIDMSNGCKKLHPLAMAGSQKNLVELDQCLCEEWNDVTKLESKAAHEEAKASAAEKLSKAQEDFREKQDEERAKERQDAEEKVSVLLWRCFLSSPDPSSFFPFVLAHTPAHTYHTRPFYHSPQPLISPLTRSSTHPLCPTNFRPRKILCIKSWRRKASSVRL